MSQAFGSSRVALRDRGFIDVLDLSFRFLREGFSPLAKLTIVVLPLPCLVTWLAGNFGNWWLGWVVAALLLDLASAPFTALAGQFVFERDPSAKTALRRGLGSIPRMIGSNVLLGMGMVASYFFFILPALFLLGATLFVPEVLILERANLLRAWERAMKLAAGGSTDAVAGTLFRVGILVVAPMLADQVGHIALATIFQVSGPPTIWQEGGGLLPALGFWLAAPYVAVLRFLLYINVRTRAEGWDIQTEFATLAARSADADKAAA